MRIEWNIAKKRGNLRPVLTYCITLADHEKVLALPPVRIASTIPKPTDSWQEYCYPGQFERGANPDHPGECYTLEAPSHRGRAWTQTLRLPWRANNSYPEVEASFLQLRAAIEAELRAADASAPMQESAHLDISPAAREAIAPGVLAERFLDLARKNTRAS